MTRNVSITIQNTDDGRSIIDAIAEDNPLAEVNVYPAMTKIDCPSPLVVRRQTVADKMGREFDMQELHLSLISLSGNIDEDDEYFSLAWHDRSDQPASREKLK